jgi:pentatricopeptide repeat protein
MSLSVDGNEEVLSLSLGFVKNKEPRRAIDLFEKIPNPNEVIVVLLLNACAQLQTKETLDLVKRISLNPSKSFLSNSYLMTSLLDALMKCGDVKSAESVFARMTKKPPEMFGAMMKGSVRHGLLSVR